MEYILVGVGGVIGSIARFQIGKVVNKLYYKKFPLATFLINITGAFLLGLLSANIKNGLAFNFLGDGVLGGYTTFSTFMYEDFKLFKGKHKLNAISYIVLSIILGVIFYGIGFSIKGI